MQLLCTFCTTAVHCNGDESCRRFAPRASECKPTASRALQHEPLTPRALQRVHFAPPVFLLCLAMAMDRIEDLHPVHQNAHLLQAVHCSTNTLHLEDCNAAALHLLHHCCALQWGWIVSEICTPCTTTPVYCKPCIATRTPHTQILATCALCTSCTAAVHCNGDGSHRRFAPRASERQFIASRALQHEPLAPSPPQRRQHAAPRSAFPSIPFSPPTPPPPKGRQQRSILLHPLHPLPLSLPFRPPPALGPSQRLVVQRLAVATPPGTELLAVPGEAAAEPFAERSEALLHFRAVIRNAQPRVRRFRPQRRQHRPMGRERGRG